MTAALNKDTLVSLGAAVAVAIAFIGGAFQIKDAIASLRDEVRDLRSRIEFADRAATDNWSAQDMEIFALRLRIDNPVLIVPDVREIHPRATKR